MASSSSSFASDSQYCPRWKYNVFLSFRGEDTRKTFTSHLYEGLKNRGIFTFQDDNRLEQGDSISEELLKAIEESQVALIIFSKNYATSRWCLNELVKIMECKEEENGQTVIPIFYDVDPSNVRYQSESFAEAFAKHESRYKDDVEGMQKVQGWRNALTAARNLKGYDIRGGLSSMKVLIVLDDIDQRDHLEYLAGGVGWFGNGSRVIVTTRNRQLIEKDVAIYEVPTLPDDDAMQLFNQHAFRKEVPDECFKKFLLEVVNHAKGLPLALKVWGSLLHKNGLTQWTRTVDQIKKKSNSEIVEKLKISYDGLEPEEQKIFLDITCFFRGHKRKEVVQIVDSCDFGAEYGLDVLIEKSLVFISKYDRIEMHDLIENMGKYIVKMQTDSGKPSRVWNVEDFEDVMMDNMGTMTVEAIWFTYSEKLCFSKEAMQNMRRLRILCMHTYSWTSQSDSEDGSTEYLSNNLCWFVWHHYPWKLLPENFNSRRLVHLDLRWSSLHYLWNETKQFLSLRRIDLSHSNSLKRTPDFNGMPNLEYLNLEECRSLEEVHHSLKYCRKLIELNLLKCESLERFPYVNVESLEYLNLKYCYSLKKFPEILGIMKQGTARKIKMSCSGIRELPLSIFDLQPHLIRKSLVDC
ncbi:hypothetical protein KY290_006958 [Solanum tuberosum]|uniref:TIR domain-containing protein n=1 Tax=Solanum tuberosum TaxID=4113 RepID=A0ABQ7W6T6_SOLTU|nr:hypothetical protein KY290_006958 [Solanum tuberosum]